jgi:dolichol-phosphate mannosyltransferase
VNAATNLSIVVPVYNEAGMIETLVRDLEREVAPVVGEIEAIFVDDASTDETPEILDRLAVERPWLQVEHVPQNAGHGAAVLSGLGHARGEWIFQIDSDGQFIVAEFSRLWERRRDSDLALGVRAHRHDPAHRLALSRAVSLATSMLAGTRIPDANTPFRLVRRTLWEDLRDLIPAGTLAPNIFVTLGSAVRGWRVAEVSVTHLARERGTSTLRSLRLLRFSLRGLRQLVAFRLSMRRHVRRLLAPPDVRDDPGYQRPPSECDGKDGLAGESAGARLP